MTFASRLLYRSQPDKIGLDVPLGWPDAFVDAVVRHRKREPFGEADIAELIRRDTDTWVRRNTHQLPLSVTTDRISWFSTGSRTKTAPTHGRQSQGRFRVVHPFHPSAGQELEFVGFGHTWGNQSIALTSNLHAAGFDTIMPKALATPAVDRLLHHAHQHRRVFAPSGRGRRREGGEASDLTSDREESCPPTWRFRVRVPGGQLSAHLETLVSVDTVAGPCTHHRVHVLIMSSCSLVSNSSTALANAADRPRRSTGIDTRRIIVNGSTRNAIQNTTTPTGNPASQDEMQPTIPTAASPPSRGPQTLTQPLGVTLDR